MVHRFAYQQKTERVPNMFVVFHERGHDASGDAKRLGERFFVECARNVFFDFHHAKISLGLVVVEWNVGFTQKAQRFFLSLLKPSNKGERFFRKRGTSNWHCAFSTIRSYTRS